MPAHAEPPPQPASPARPSQRIAGVYFLRFPKFGDARGYFFESYRRSWIPGAREMVQGNCSFSKAGVLRGLHYHLQQADLWTLPSGRVRAALYDLRRSSPTRGASELIELVAADPVGVYIPKGIAHGFYTLEDSFMTYFVDQYYDGADELGVRWNDPALGIDWGIESPIMSDRDLQNPGLAEIPEAEQPL